MSWRVLYVEESDSLSLYLDNIRVKKGTNEYTFPLSDISLVIVDNYKITLSINLLNACSLNNIPFISCGDNHHPLCILLPLHGHFESSKILFDQLKWSEEYKSKLWKFIVKKKIEGQRFVLNHLNKDSESISILDKYINEIEPFDSTNREGLAAKVYFRALFGNNFSRRDETTINACLNYGYSIIRAMICKVIVAKGLNTQLGIFHKGPENAFNLADDIIEIFRPIVDLFVCQRFLNEKIFTRDIRLKILELINYKIIVNEQKCTINHAIEKIVDGIIQFFNNGNLSNLISFEPVAYDL